jgi:nitroreductase
MDITGALPATEIVNTLLQDRRSVFTQQFEPGKKIPDEIIWQALENANWAPSHKLTQPWRFTVFTGESLQKLAEDQAAVYKETTSGPNFKQNTYDKLLVTPQLCSHIISIGCKRSIDQLPEWEEVASVACAVQNIYLTLTSYGFGGYWSSGGITSREEAKALFGLGPDDILMGFFYAGCIRVPSAKGVRKSVREKVTWK